ncbi:hypothetical protein GGH13_005751 [Coemansia sp. S155-1]|nr:hypothetical protein GGH13_005751 [Coemansia sp. S155-1]
MTRIYLVAATLLALPAINAQFQFNPGTYDAAELFIQISGFYTSYASIWSTQLAQAKSSLPGAYSELTSIFNTDSIPESFDPAFVSHLAQEMVEIGHTTVIDPLITASTLVFTRTSGSTPTPTPTPTASGSSPVRSSTTRPSSSNSQSQVASTSATSTSGLTSGSGSTPASDSDVFTLSNSSSPTTSSDNGAVSIKHAYQVFGVSATLALALAGSLFLF